jgi:hypothetical protein
VILLLVEGDLLGLHRGEGVCLEGVIPFIGLLSCFSFLFVI